MSRLFHKLLPFSPDYSGAASVLYGLGGMCVFVDAGACMGTYLFGSEPRGFIGINYHSAALRERQVVMGIDQKVIKDASISYETYGGDFVALIGTPVPGIIGADLEGIAKEISLKISKDRQIPAFGIDTMGLANYDIGIQKGYEALVDAFAFGEKRDCLEDAPEVNVIGATPLDMWEDEQKNAFSKVLQEEGWKRIAIWGPDAGLEAIKAAGAAKLNVAVSVAAIKICKILKERFGTPYRVGYPVGQKVFASDRTEKRALIIGEQVRSNEIRKYLKREKGYKDVQVASYFLMEPEYMEEGDLHLKTEEELKTISEGYDLVIADPMLCTAMEHKAKKVMKLPHMATSGMFFLNQNPVLIGADAEEVFQNC